MACSHVVASQKRNIHGKAYNAGSIALSEKPHEDGRNEDSHAKEIEQQTRQRRGHEHRTLTNTINNQGIRWLAYIFVDEH